MLVARPRAVYRLCEEVRGELAHEVTICDGDSETRVIECLKVDEKRAGLVLRLSSLGVVSVRKARHRKLGSPPFGSQLGRSREIFHFLLDYSAIKREILALVAITREVRASRERIQNCSENLLAIVCARAKSRKFRRPSVILQPINIRAWRSTRRNGNGKK